MDNYSGNIVFSVDFKGKELLIPFNEDFLVSIDKHNKTAAVISAILGGILLIFYSHGVLSLVGRV